MTAALPPRRALSDLPVNAPIALATMDKTNKLQTGQKRSYWQMSVTEMPNGSAKGGNDPCDPAGETSKRKVGLHQNPVLHGAVPLTARSRPSRHFKQHHPILLSPIHPPAKKTHPPTTPAAKTPPLPPPMGPNWTARPSRSRRQRRK